MDYWRMMGFLPTSGVSITLVNLLTAAVSPPFHSVIGDARDLAQFQDRAFDVAFSNSVIEHVGGADDQQRMASEAMRVASHYFVQTPNRYFPVEPHFLVPGFQFMPNGLKAQLVTRFDLGFYAAPEIPKHEAREHARTIRLLSASDLRRLFPGCVLYRERILGITKSLMAIGGWSDRPGTPRKEW